jgi:hypothetical protein
MSSNDPAPAIPAFRRRLWLLPLILAIIPLWLAVNYTTLVPRADHWGVVVAPYQKIREGAPFWETIHSRFNDSRMDLPILIHQSLIRFTGWNLKVESALCGLLAALTVALMLRECRVFFQTPGRDLWGRVLPWVAAWWVLSPRQWMNWTWGIQICYTMVVFLTMAALVCLRSNSLPSWPRIGAAALLAVAACLTFVNGWLVWILGAGFLFWSWQRHGWREARHAGAFVAWLVAAGVMAWLSFSSGESVSHQHGEGGLLKSLLADPRPVIGYFFHVLGAPFSDVILTWDRGDIRLRINETASMTFASVSLLAGAVLLYRGLRGDWKGHTAAVTLCWLFAAWGLANAAAIAIARTGVMASNPFESRYGAFTIWWHIALLGLWSLVRTPWLRRLRWVWLAAVMWGSLTSAAMGLRDMRSDFDRNRPMCVAAAFRHVAPDTVYLTSLSSLPEAETVAGLDLLEKDGLLAVPTIRESSPGEVPEWKNGARGAFESAAFEAGVIHLRGWAVRNRDRDSVDGVAISIQPAGEAERWIGVSQRRGSREKLARKEKSIALQYRVGWDCLLAIGGGGAPPAGTATFRAYAVDLETGQVSRLEGEWKLELPITPKAIFR